MSKWTSKHDMGIKESLIQLSAECLQQVKIEEDLAFREDEFREEDHWRNIGHVNFGPDLDEEIDANTL